MKVLIKLNRNTKEKQSMKVIKLQDYFVFLIIGVYMKKKKYIIKKLKLKIRKKLKSIYDGIIFRKIKQCFRLSLSFVNALLEIFIPQKYDDTYASLTPTKDADKDEIYCNALKFALENEEIKNIAIAGNYGSGKSSVIKTFF